MNKNRGICLLMLCFAALIGSSIAVIMWVFLKICNLGVTIIWDYMPDLVTTPFYTIIVCVIGGLVIGLFHKVYGDFPETIKEVMQRVKTDKILPFKNIPVVMTGTFLALFFGGAVGPESGLVGVLVGLCFWAMDQLYMGRDKMESLMQTSPQMGKGKVFCQMANGLLVNPQKIGYSKSVQWTKAEGIFAAAAAVIPGFIVYELFNYFFGRCINIPHLSGGDVNKLDILFLIILIAVGIAAGYLYMLFKKITSFIFGGLAAKGFTVLNALLGGAALGIIGTFIPMTMFSGGNEMQVMQYDYLQYTPVLLIIIGVVKLLLTNICIQSGWRGGHFFPLIFSGLSIGYGMAVILECNQILCVVVVCGALLGTVTQQPFGAFAISLLFFPIQNMGWMIAASFVGGCLPLPKVLRVNPEDRGFICSITQGDFRKKLPMR